uniref:Uncharacterized protein n=1 Tax=Ananas comosus var. bracteatus TaxID=296719 RepID=A0A6V7NM26_ANACO|nr:unnamed protein product [Ananas comosus var. bracteatus]
MFMIISLNYINHCIRGGNKIVLGTPHHRPHDPTPKKPFSAHLPVTFAAAPRWFSSPPVSLRHAPISPPLLVVHRRGEITSGELTPPRSPPTLPLYVAIAVSFTSPTPKLAILLLLLLLLLSSHAPVRFFTSPNCLFLAVIFTFSAAISLPIRGLNSSTGENCAIWSILRRI